MPRKKIQKKKSDKEQICKFKRGKLRCKNVSGDNKRQFCEKHYKIFTDFLAENPSCVTYKWAEFLPQKQKMEFQKKMKKKLNLPSDEHRCCLNNGMGWRCKNFRFGHGPNGADSDAESVPNTRFCEKHYNSFKKKNNGSGAGSSSATARETRGSKRRKTVSSSEEEYETETETQEDTSDDNNFNAIVEGGSSETKGEDDQSVSLDETETLQDTNDDNFDAVEEGGSAETEGGDVERIEGSGELESLRVTGEPLVELESLEQYKSMCLQLSVELEKKKVECTTLQGKLVEVETRKTAAADETEPTPADETECWKKMFSDLESRVLRIENENPTIAKIKSQLRKSSVECLESRISKMEDLVLRLEDKISTMGCSESRISKLEGLVLRMEDKISTMGCSESRISKLESLVLSMKNENSTTGCLESRISKLESLVLRTENETSQVPRSGKESWLSRCVELQKMKAPPGFQYKATQSGEKQRDKDNSSNFNAETSSAGRKDSQVYEFKTQEKVVVYNRNKHHAVKSEFPKYSAMNISSASLHLSSIGKNIKEEKGWGCLEGIPSQHGSSSQAHLEMSEKNFVDLVSDSDDGGDGLGKSEDSDADPMDMMTLENWNGSKDEMNWKSEADMLSSFEEVPELCMKAVCALYRQEISEDEISPKGLLFHSDTLRCTALAKFLTNKDCNGDLKKSVQELGTLDSKAVDDCKRLAKRYSVHLFDLYQNRKDPFFHPATAASHGDQTA